MEEFEFEFVGEDAVLIVEDCCCAADDDDTAAVIDSMCFISLFNNLFSL